MLSGQLGTVTLALVTECEQACGHILLNYPSLRGAAKYRTVSELCLPERLRWEVGLAGGGGVIFALSSLLSRTG